MSSRPLEKFAPEGLPEGWRRMRIGEAIEEASSPIEMRADEAYLLASVRRRFGGMFHRERLYGREILTKNLQRVMPGSFVIARMQIVHGACALADEQFQNHVISKSYSSFKSTEHCDTRFFSKLAEQPFMTEYFRDASHGVVIEKMTFQQGRWLEFPVWLPPLEEQRRIAEILDTIDESIHATERVIAKLEMRRQAVSQAVFGRRSWHSALEAVVVGSLLVRPPRNGRSPHEGERWRGAFMLGLGCLTESGFSPQQLKRAPEVDGSLRQALLADGDLLMSRSNTEDRVGFVGQFRSVGHPCIYPDLMMRLVPRTQVSARYLELALQSGPARRQIRTLASGTSGSMVKITGEAVSKLSVAICSPADQARYCDAFDALSDRRNVEELRLSKLRDLRAGVAADLLSGRVSTVAA